MHALLASKKFGKRGSTIFEIALVLVRFDQITRRIVNANHGIV